jgi:hypothetical protein
MNMDDMTIGEAKKIAAMFGDCNVTEPPPAPCDAIPVLVCTDKRGVVFGYTTNPKADPITVTGARMCLYWSQDVGGVFGLAENGPTKDCKISATSKSVALSGITAVFEVEPEAVKLWESAPVQGR